MRKKSQRIHPRTPQPRAVDFGVWPTIINGQMVTKRIETTVVTDRTMTLITRDRSLSL